MKRLLFFVCMTSILAAGVHAQLTPWNSLPSYEDQRFNAIVTLSTTSVLFGTGDGYIFRSDNQGNSLMLIHTTSTGNGILSMKMLGQTIIGTVAGGYLVKSTDQGATWIDIDVTAITSYDLNDVYMMTELEFWVVGDGKNNVDPITILHTIDGGTSFDKISNSYTKSSGDAITFINSNTIGIIGYGDGIIVSPDGGQTWVEPASIDFSGIDYTRKDIRSLVKLNDNTVIGVGWGSFASGLQNTIILKSYDGVSWTNMAPTGANAAYANAYGLFFEDENTGYLGLGGTAYGGAIQKTTDGGETWQLINVCPNYIYSIGKVGNRLLFGGNYSGLWASDNSGASFSPLAKSTSACFAIDASGDEIVMGGRDGMFLYSGDKGANFQYGLLATPDRNQSQIQSIAIDPTSSRIWAVGLQFIKKYSDDHGQTWNSAGEWEMNSLSSLECIKIYSDGIYAAGRIKRPAENKYDDLILKSSDNGVTWDTLTQANSAGNYAVSMAKSGNLIAYTDNKGNLIISSDNGATWQTKPTATTKTLNDILFDESRIWCGGGQGALMLTEDNGDNWTSFDLGTTNNIYDMAKSGTKILALDQRLGIYVTEDAGDNWTLLPFADTTLFYYQMTVVDDQVFITGSNGTIEQIDLSASSSGLLPNLVIAQEVLYNDSIASGLIFKPGCILDNGQTIWLSGDAGSAAGASYVFLSTDGGQTFTQSPPIEGRVANLDAFDANTALIAMASGHIWKTEDGGESWIDVYSYTNGEWFDGLCIINDTVAVAFGDGPNDGYMHFVRTEDRGEFWDEISGIDYMNSAYAIYSWGTAIMNIGDTIFAGACNSGYNQAYFYRSYDAGMNWETFEVMTGVSGRINGVAMINGQQGLASGRISAGVSVILATTDGGETWDECAQPGDSATYINSVTAIPGTNIIVAGGDANEVFYTDDLGATWESVVVEGEEANDFLGGLFLNQNTGYMFTYNGPVYKFNTTSTAICETPGISKQKKIFELQSNFPNPFNPQTHIRFKLNQSEQVQLVVFDILGRHIATLINQTLPAGEHTVTYQPAQSATGVYYYMLKAGKQVESRKMMFIK